MSTAKRRKIKRALTSPVAYLYLAPALLVFGVFTIWPTIYTFIVSLYNWNWLNPAMNKFVGAKNYVDVVQGNRDPNFWYTMWVSLKFVFAMVIGGTVLGLALAMLLRRSTKINYAARTVVFLANITPLVATSIVWVWIFNPRFGLANSLFRMAGLQPIDWFAHANSSMAAVIIYSMWHDLGFTTLIFLGGLTTLSKDLSEAAKLDGASAWKEFFYVTLPQIRPFILFVLVITSVSSLQAFTQFFVMTGGGPNFDTVTLGFSVYQQAFVFRKTGYAAALAVVLFAITVAFSLLQMRTSRSMERS